MVTNDILLIINFELSGGKAINLTSS